MKKITILLIIVSLSAFAQKDTTAIRFSKTITATDLKTHLSILASDEYEGRETGKKGQKMAAEYIQKQFESFGIPPYKEKTYYQEYPLNVIMPAAAEVTANEKKYTSNVDYFNFSGLTEQTINTKEIIFLGYGIDENNVYSDYKGTKTEGKVIMIMEGEPYKNENESIITGKKTPSLWTSYYKVKIERAKESKVAAVLYVVDNISESMEKFKHKIESPAMKLDMSKKEMPVIYISKEMANEILKKQTIETIKTKIANTGKPQKTMAKTNFSIKIKNNAQHIFAENVLGFVEGSDLKEEIIVITAHYDHLGIDGTVVFNGADDDGSGTVAVIELAQAFAEAKKQGKGPRRSMLFMTVSGEEKGLLGSAYYVDHPEFPLKNTVCDLNIDMIGRLDEKHANNANYVYLIGSDKLSSQLHNISENANKTYCNIELDYTYNDEKDKNRFYYRSDHYNFVKKGIPVIFYFNGVHADYHKETDEVEKIDFAKMENITRLVFFTAWDLANRKERIIIDSNKK